MRTINFSGTQSRGIESNLLSNAFDHITELLGDENVTRLDILIGRAGQGSIESMLKISSTLARLNHNILCFNETVTREELYALMCETCECNISLLDRFDVVDKNEKYKSYIDEFKSKGNLHVVLENFNLNDQINVDIIKYCLSNRISSTITMQTSIADTEESIDLKADTFFKSLGLSLYKSKKKENNLFVYSAGKQNG